MKKIKLSKLTKIFSTEPDGTTIVSSKQLTEIFKELDLLDDPRENYEVCPFCGGEPVIDMVYAYCDHDGCPINSILVEASMWNTRWSRLDDKQDVKK